MRHRRSAIRLIAFLGRAGQYLLMLIISLWCLFPLYLILVNSFKNKREVYQPGKLLVVPKLTNYVRVLFEQEVGSYILNSAIIAICSTLLALVLGGLIGFGMSRFRIRGKSGILKSVLLVRQLPPITLVLPFFIIGFLSRTLDTHLLLIIIYLTFNVPLSVWMLKGFFFRLIREMNQRRSEE